MGDVITMGVGVEGKVRPGQTGMCVCVVRSQYSSMELDCDKNAPKPRFTARSKTMT